MSAARVPEIEQALAAGEFQDALARLAALLPPTNEDAIARCRVWLLAAEALAGLGRHAEARGHLLHAWVPAAPLDSLPSLRACELRVRLMLRERPLPAEAVSQCLLDLEDDAVSRSALLEAWALALEEEGEFAAALHHCREALAAQGRGRVALHLGRMEHRAGHTAAALGSFDAVLATSTDATERAEALLRRTLVTRQLAEFAALPEGLRPLKRMVEEGLDGPVQDESDWARHWGGVAFRHGLFRDAHGWLARAVELDSVEGNGDTRRELALVVARWLGDESRVRALCERADDVRSVLLAAACQRGEAGRALALRELMVLTATAGDEANEEWLRDRRRSANSALPHLARLEELQDTLRPGDLFATVLEAEGGAWLFTCTATTAKVVDLEVPLAEALGGSIEDVRQLLWMPPNRLLDEPVAGLSWQGRFLVEKVIVVHVPSASWLVHQAAHPVSRPFGRAVIVEGTETEGVAATLWFPTRIASPAALPEHLSTAKLIHSPSMTDHTADLSGLPLVVLTQGDPSEARRLLACGVRGIVIPVGQGVQSPLWWAVHRHRMVASPAEAVALAQREALNAGLTNALGLAYYGVPESLPVAGVPWSWLARLGQTRHARHYPLTRSETNDGK